MRTDNDADTTDVGLYHYATSYHSAADALEKLRQPVTHPEAPREFLYYHAIELYIKAFLRHNGLSIGEIRKMGHGAQKLRQAYLENGGWLDDEDNDVLDLMTPENVIRSRYIKTGAFRKAALEALARTCESLRDTVRGALMQAGRPIR